jgi:hypothetical protein
VYAALLLVGQVQSAVPLGSSYANAYAFGPAVGGVIVRITHHQPSMGVRTVILCNKERKLVYIFNAYGKRRD